jgi:glycosyltransferase involved in cell wall biosynthesis
VSELPRLCYIGDVPIEASLHGSTLLYRLLQNYPSGSIVAVEQECQLSLPDRRLPEVRYEQLRNRVGRLLTTRFHVLAKSWLTITAERKAQQIATLLGKFDAQAVLTVAHGFSWLSASAFAERNGLPLHLIVHDDWPRLAPLIPPVSRWMGRRFGDVYRRAASRLCVSPMMVDHYERRYGVRGTLLYPSRASDTPIFERIGHATASRDRPLTVAYAGSLSVEDYIRQVVALSRLLPSVRGRLLLFGPGHEFLVSRGINVADVTFGGMLSSQQLIRRIHAEADVAFVPESFEPGDPRELSFPSKLADYTAAAIPLLIWGPQGSAAVRWATANPGVAAVVTDREEASMANMLLKLTDSAWREQLSAASVDVGKRYFSAERAEAVFYEALFNKCFAEGRLD